MRSPARNWVEYLLARAVLATLAVGPRGVSHALARMYTRLLDLVIPKLRRVAMRNLAMTMPELGVVRHRAITDESFQSLARILVAVARFPRITKDNVAEWIRYDGVEHFHTVKARGKGVLFATAHYGNWELSAFTHALMTEPMHIVVRGLDNPLLDRLSLDRRTLSGNRVIEKRGFVRGILRALGANEAVGILIDQNRGLDDGIFVDFFGLRACVDSGFTRVATHSGAGIILGYALWSESEQRHILRFHPPVWATGDERADTQRIHVMLEQVIRADPGQWLWMHRRWKTRPPGEPPLYGEAR